MKSFQLIPNYIIVTGTSNESLDEKLQVDSYNLSQ